MSSNITNALFRKNALAGVALLRLSSKQRIDVDADIKRFRDNYEKLARCRARDILEFRLDLCRVSCASLSHVAAALSSLLRISDAEIDTLTRRLGLAGLYYLSGLGLVPI